MRARELRADSRESDRPLLRRRRVERCRSELRVHRKLRTHLRRGCCVRRQEHQLRPLVRTRFGGFGVGRPHRLELDVRVVRIVRGVRVAFVESNRHLVSLDCAAAALCRMVPVLLLPLFASLLLALVFLRDASLLHFVAVALVPLRDDCILLVEVLLRDARLFVVVAQLRRTSDVMVVFDVGFLDAVPQGADEDGQQLVDDLTQEDDPDAMPRYLRERELFFVQIVQVHHVVQYTTSAISSTISRNRVK